MYVYTYTYMNLLLLCSLTAYGQRILTFEKRTLSYVRVFFDFLVVFELVFSLNL